MTATTSRNEAAERIDLLVDLYVSQSLRTLARKFGHEALAAERRATVERIVDAIPTLEWIILPDSIIDPFRAEGWPFDEEAAR